MFSSFFSTFKYIHKYNSLSYLFWVPLSIGYHQHSIIIILYTFIYPVPLPDFSITPVFSNQFTFQV